MKTPFPSRAAQPPFVTARPAHPAKLIQARSAHAQTANAPRPIHPAMVSQQRPAAALTTAQPSAPAGVPQKPIHPALIQRQVAPSPAAGASGNSPTQGTPAKPTHPALIQRQVAPLPSQGTRGNSPTQGTPAKPTHPALIQRQVAAPAPQIPVSVAKPRAPHPATIAQRRTPPPASAANGVQAKGSPTALATAKPRQHPAIVQRQPASPTNLAATRKHHPATIQLMDIDPPGFGNTGFQRPDFRGGVSKSVTFGINEELTNSGYNTVARSDFDVAHKVPFEAIRNLVMDYLYENGSTNYTSLVKKTDVFYTQDTSRYGVMYNLRDTLGGWVKKYGYLNKGTMVIIDAANKLLTELNSASDNLGLGIPTENRSLGPRVDPVISSWNSKTQDITFSPRTDAIDDEWDITNNMAYDSSGRPRSSQITSFFN